MRSELSKSDRWCDWSRAVALGPWLARCGASLAWSPDHRLPRVCGHCGRKVRHVSAYVRTVHAIDQRLAEVNERAQGLEPRDVAVSLPIVPAATARAPIAASTEDGDRVLALVDQGVRMKRDLLRAAAQLPMHRQRLERTLYGLVSTGALAIHGPAKDRWYTRANVPAHVVAQAAPAARRVVIDQGVMLETVWNGQRGDASLLGERMQRHANY